MGRAPSNSKPQTLNTVGSVLELQAPKSVLEWCLDGGEARLSLT